MVILTIVYRQRCSRVYPPWLHDEDTSIPGTGIEAYMHTARSLDRWSRTLGEMLGRCGLMMVVDGLLMVVDGCWWLLMHPELLGINIDTTRNGDGWKWSA